MHFDFGSYMYFTVELLDTAYGKLKNWGCFNAVVLARTD